MSEPLELGSLLTDALAKVPADALRRPVLDGMAAQHRRNQDRRAAVLAHEDLRDRLVKELGYSRADHWNGYVPPATVNEFSAVELLLSPAGRFNQFGNYTAGEMANQSPRRVVLLEISRLARERQNI